ACNMLSPLIIGSIILVMVASASATMLTRDVAAARLRERVGNIRSRPLAHEESSAPPRTLGIRSRQQRHEHLERFMRFLRFNPDVPQQNVIPWKLVFAIACAAAVGGFFYGREYLSWPVAVLMAPIEGVLVARFIFGWERGRFQKALLQQIPDV